MFSLIYNDIDPVSKHAHAFIESSAPNDKRIKFVMQSVRLVDSIVPENTPEPAIFLSKHVSSKEVPSFTVHSEGNWSAKAELGGEPHKLSMASPSEMLNVLTCMSKIKENISVTYEATHHGPFTEKRSFFAEVGGNDAVINNPEMANLMAKAVLDSLDMGEDFKKVVFGIGGNHYASRFTKLALEKRYAFSHIMPRYYAEEMAMVEQAVKMSYPVPEIAVIEWKSLTSTQRNEILKKLNEIGIDYERI
ncbi:MAG: D-aminoacyl-tRNA deacylase [Candidatus Marsarchaeota archaeon]|nr:D-aminoacyl-tRNA deacylase [Candidatus Marsarchaeota archaeon]MCL5102158.1 D-aminoacyl-tRNA deacylase [Candidatus Marsarchaeota archaeon]